MKKRNNNIILISILLASITAPVMAQKNLSDTSSLNEVIITATRTERKLSNVAVPVNIISQKNIASTGIVRLQEILQEQTGLFVTSGSGSGGFGGGVFGNGIQIQGMSPDYTLMLINGEPIIGRQGGTIDLSRFTTGNIKKIEIIKGPSSSLYGSEAMGGVINIITQPPVANQLSIQTRAGGYGLYDANVTGTLVTEKTNINASFNHYRFGGFDYEKTKYGNTQDPFRNYTGQLMITHHLSPLTKLILYTRYFTDKSTNTYEVPDSAGNKYIGGNIKVNDFNINPTIVHKFSNSIQSSLRFYFSNYESIQTLNENKSGQPYYYDYFNQQFYRAEDQTDFKLPANNTVSAGGGFTHERLNTNRYSGIRSNNIIYGFLQNEWAPVQNLNIIGGIRYDNNEAYASRFSPKLAIRYSPTNKIKLTASYGAGFKAPDFRQLFLNLTNSAAGGYSVFGSNEISYEKLLELQQQGLISQVFPRARDLQKLNPETSSGINAGIQYKAGKKWLLDLNLFNNDISNQIIFDVIGTRSNGASVFGYFNVNRSFTRGGELNVQYQPHQNWQLSAGYQLLYTGDKDVLAKIKAGQEYGRSSVNGEVYLLQKNEYYGLPNRSRHMINAKIFYNSPSKGWQASVRAIYRSRWGTFDKDGNGIINRKDETAEGFLLLNMNIAKTINQHWQVMAGGENLLNHRDAFNLPSVPGINWFVSIRYELKKTINK